MHSEYEILSNRIDAVNELHAHLNLILPQIKSVFLKYMGKKVVNKTTGTLTEAVKKDVEQLIKYGAGMRKHFRISGESIYFCADISYRTGEFTCDYFRRDTFIASYETINNTLASMGDEFATLKTDFNLLTVLEKEAEAKKIRDEMGEKLRAIESEIHPVIK